MEEMNLSQIRYQSDERWKLLSDHESLRTYLLDLTSKTASANIQIGAHSFHGDGIFTTMQGLKPTHATGRKKSWSYIFLQVAIEVKQIGK